MTDATAVIHGGHLESQVALARAGNRKALEAVVKMIHQDIYGLALRFLWHPEDAEDATQEILIRVITGLTSFKGESSFRTWVYRVSSNTLLTLRKQRMERQAMSFEAFGEDLAQGLSDKPAPMSDEAERMVLLEEVKVGCTTAMLLCLDRLHRLAYILGEILELDQGEAAHAMQITKAAYRKRLSRARRRIEAFMRSHCGLVNPGNPCRCSRRVDTAIAQGRVNPSALMFANSPAKAKKFPRVLASIRQLEDLRRGAALYRSHPDPLSSMPLEPWLQEVIEGWR